MSDRELVPLEAVDEATACPECGTAVDLAMTQELVQEDGDLYVLDLGYVCPDCRHDWTEPPARHA